MFTRHPPHSLFERWSNLVGGGIPPSPAIPLTAKCYRTLAGVPRSLDGDPEKDEIAQAQSYFAVKTREAEVAQSISYEPAHHQLPQQRDAVEYIEATKTLESLLDSRIKRLLEARLMSELSLDCVNQSQALLPAEQPKQYTTATVRAAQLGYSAKRIGNGSALGTFVGKTVKQEFRDWQGQYMVWHYEVSDELDDRIHAYFS